MSDRMKRTLIIETEVDRKTLSDSEKVVKNFFDKHEDKKMKISAPDFQGILQPIRDIEKEITRVAEKMPHMLGSISMDQQFLVDIKEAFKDVEVMFTDGSIAKGFDEIIEKTKTLAIRSVDLGEFASTLRKSAQDAVNALKKVGAIQSDYNGKNYLDLSNLNTKQLQDAITLMEKLKESQEELDSFNGEPLKRADLYSGTTTNTLSSRLERAKTDLDELKRLNLATMEELDRRKNLQSDISGGAWGRYDEWEFGDIKKDAKNDEAIYRDALSNLQKYVSDRNDILQILQDNSHLFTTDEINEYTNTLTNNISQAKLQIQELQQIGGKTADAPIGGDFTKVTEILEEIKTSLQTISDVFKNENDAMRSMVDGEISSFTSWSEAIIAVYNNLSRLEGLVDTISQKDFNITNITSQATTSASKRHTVKQLKADIEEEMKHVKMLFDDAYSLVDQLNKNKMRSEAFQAIGMIGGVDEATGLPIPMRYDNFQQEILEGMASAKTKAKLENILVLIDGYITKLTEVNKLREKYGFGEWKDSFDRDVSPVTQPIIRAEEPAVLTQQTEAKIDVSPVDGSETQQINNLKGAVDEVSKAIGRKNAGFIKEQEIVAASVEAEKAKLKELVDVINNEIGSALDNIKAKFAQSFVVPELDKNSLQTSFDEIYNKFIELKDKIGGMQIDIGIDSANITTAIQEALYTKEIAKNYKKITSFDQIFDDFTWGYDAEAMNKFTNEILSLDEAREMFSNEFYGKFMSHDGKFIGDTNEMLSNLMQQLDNTEPEQDEWAKVIVEAINTQGNNIVEAIKILLPKSVGDSIDTIDETQFVNAFQTLSQAISTWSRDTHLPPGSFFERLKKQQWSGLGDANTSEVKNALRTLGMISSSDKPTFTIADQGLRNLGVAIADQFVLPTRPGSLDQTSELIPLLNEASKLGAAIPRIVSAFNDGSKVFELQTRMLGKNIASNKSNPEFVNATDEQIDRLIHTFEVLSQVGLYPDFVGDNILFDKQKGFSLVDLETRNISWNAMDTPEDMVRAFLKNALRGVDFQQSKEFKRRVNGRLALPAEQRLVNASAIVSEKNTAHQNKVETNLNEVKITPTMDEGAVAKVVDENVKQTPATVKIKPVIDGTDKQDQNVDEYDYGLTVYYDDLNIDDTALDTQQSVNDESQSAVDVAKAFVDAANAKRQFVEANKKVAEGAKTSADAVKKEADATKNAGSSMSSTATSVAKNLAKIKTIVDKDGKTVHTAEVQKFKTDDAFVTETTNRDADDNITSITLVKDFEKLAAEAKKSEVAVAKAQTTLDEFLARFKSKTGGNARFIDGFSELQNTTVTSDNIDEVFNKMRGLQEKYSELEANFRKGQSSLNPFVNAINNSEKIGNIFADVEHKYNGLTKKTQELTNNFTRLKILSEEISAFNQKMKAEPDSITSVDFTDFSKQVGEFNVLKAQIEGTIKTESRLQKEAEEQRKQGIHEYIELIKKRNAYELKAQNAKDGSRMQSFYIQQANKIQEKIQQYDEHSILNQEEKNKLLAIEEAHQRVIAEILEKKDISESLTKEDDNIKQKYDAGYLSKDLYLNWEAELADYRSYLDGTTQADEVTIQEKRRLLTQLYNELTKISNKSKTFFASGGEMLSQDYWLDKNQINNLSESLSDIYQRIASERFDGMKTSVAGVNEQLGKLNFTVDDGKGSLTQYTILLDRASGATKLLTNNTKPALTTLQKFGAVLSGDIRGIFTAFIGGMSILHTVGNYIKNGIQDVRELDAALTELKKVTDETEETYDRFLETAANTGARIGRTITDVTSATAEFAKLGYDIGQATAMAESALVYANVGDGVDVETGSQSIISTLKAFNIETNNTMSIVDKFNEIGNNFAITTAGIGDALQVSASAMAAAGNTLDETIALTTAANTIVQNPNTVGTALKTLSLRIRGVKTELEEAGLETEGMAETTSQLQAKLKALTDGKVDIMVDANNFKNTTQILREMSEEWENMTDVEQADCCLYVQKCT